MSVDKREYTPDEQPSTLTQSWLDSLVVPESVAEVQPTDPVKLNGPPGTGKSTEMERRLALLSTEHGIDLSDVTVVTYRKSLAQKWLVDLVDIGIIEKDELIDPNNGRTRHIGTIHAIAMRAAGNRWCNKSPPKRTDKIDFMQSIYNRPYDAPENKSWMASPGELIFQVYQWLKNNCRSLSEAYRAPAYHDLLASWKSHPPLPDFAQEWERYKRDNNLFDFFEVLEYAIENKVYPPTDVVMVDEYHDFNALMDRVARMWLTSAVIPVVAGDAHQTINSYDGADPQYFRRLDLPKLDLPITYRVPRNLWKIATGILAKSHTPPNVDFRRGEEGEISEIHSPRFEYSAKRGGWQVPTAESGSPYDIIRRYRGGGPIMYLTRTKMMAYGVGYSLRKAGIVYSSQRGVGGWDQTPDDIRIHLFNAIQRFRGLEVSPNQNNAWSKKQDYRLAYADWADSDSRVQTHQGPPQTIPVQEADAILQHSPSHLLKINKTEISYILSFYKDGGVDMDISNFFSLVNSEKWLTVMNKGHQSALKLVDLRARDRDLEKRTLYAALKQHSGVIPTVESNGKRIPDLSEYPIVQTIHASKGSQARTVVLYDGITRKISESIRRSPAERANETRVWWVGMTRSSHRLIIVRDAAEWLEPYLPYRLTKGVG